ncbi:hypothetical protein [uncultured Reyranella sp.]|uniref:hypothetical protein n=1 Tax=uncultured Reyranella sp. TaxID=735512 RepID=UPI00259D0CC9|nr:hypothetical protein [uncultured Reyranella sp.]
MSKGVDQLAAAAAHAADKARWFVIAGPAGRCVTNMVAVFGYRGHELSITTKSIVPYGAAFKPERPSLNGRIEPAAFLFEFDASPEGLAQACRQIDALIDGGKA